MIPKPTSGVLAFSLSETDPPAELAVSDIRYTMFGHEVTPAQRDRIEHVGIQQWTDTHPRLVTKWIAEHEAQFAEMWVDGKLVPKPQYAAEWYDEGGI